LIPTSDPFKVKLIEFPGVGGISPLYVPILALLLATVGIFTACLKILIYFFLLSDFLISLELSFLTPFLGAFFRRILAKALL
jgi:hypothetical protein